MVTPHSFMPGKIARGIGMIIKARHCLNKNALLTLYYSFIYPYLIYCNVVWGWTYANNLKNKIAKKLLKLLPMPDTETLLVICLMTCGPFY